jgi:FkbM family methyltransferase
MGYLRSVYRNLKKVYRNRKANQVKGWHIHHSHKLGLNLLLNLDNYIDYLIFRNDQFEPQVLQAISRMITQYKVSTFVDVGSNIGQMSMYVARNFPQVKVVSFEAYHKNYSQHQASMLLNNLEYNLRLVAVSDREETLTLYLPKIQEDYDHGKFNPGMTSITLDSFREETNKIEVQARTLPQLLQVDGTTPHTGYMLVKIDVEGAELKVINGFADYLKQHGGIILIIEMLFEKEHQLYNQVRQMLDEAGYAMFDLDMQQITSDRGSLHENADYIFIKER